MNTILFWAGVIVAIGAASGVIIGGARAGSRFTVSHVSKRLNPQISAMIASAQAETMEDVMREIVKIKERETTCHDRVMGALMTQGTNHGKQNEEILSLLNQLHDDATHMDSRIDRLFELAAEKKT